MLPKRSAIAGKRHAIDWEKRPLSVKQASDFMLEVFWSLYEWDGNLPNTRTTH